MSDMEWLKIFTDNLNSLLQETGMTIKELAEETGIHRSTINRYLNGLLVPTVKSVINIAYALDVDIYELAPFDERIE